MVVVSVLVQTYLPSRSPGYRQPSPNVPNFWRSPPLPTNRIASAVVQAHTGRRLGTWPTRSSTVLGQQLEVNRFRYHNRTNSLSPFKNCFLTRALSDKTAKMLAPPDKKPSGKASDYQVAINVSSSKFFLRQLTPITACLHAARLVLKTHRGTSRMRNQPGSHE